MTRKFYLVEKDNDDVVKLHFIENGVLGTYTQDLKENGIDIKRVMRPIDENTENSLKNKVTFNDGQLDENIQFMSGKEFIRQMGWLLR